MTNTDTLIGQIARSADFSNKHWTRTKPAGTLVEFRASAIERGSDCIYAYIPGTRYSAILPAAMIQPV